MPIEQERNILEYGFASGHNIIQTIHNKSLEKNRTQRTFTHYLPYQTTTKHIQAAILFSIAA